MELLTIKEDREFLAAQLDKGRRGAMGGVDKNLARSVKLREENRSRISQQQCQVNPASAINELEPTASTSEGQSSSPSPTGSPTISLQKRMRPGNIKVITPALTSTLDRTGISHRSAFRIVEATAISLGHDPQNLMLNCETMRKS